MSLSHVIPYLTDKITEKGFSFVEKPFENDIPTTTIDKSFYIIIQNVYSDSRSMIDLPLICQAEVRLFRKGYYSESLAREESINDSEIIIKNIMKISNANTQLSIKNVTMRSIDFEMLKDNDNTIMSKILFDIKLIIDPNL